MRSLAYPERHVYILPFGIDDQARFNQIRNLYAFEIHSFIKNKQKGIGGGILVVGLKSELREASAKSEFKEYVTIEEGIRLAQAIGADAYIECSAVTGSGVLEVFQEAALIGMKAHNLMMNKEKEENEGGGATRSGKRCSTK